ncbi:GH92 family glycosyl hydrolase [Streptomyces sp. NPDC055966]|uniref:GH92 family glycosyl hydrolase n=1 Tax=Streptomyces sp. NPDC055966 TaxID=3345669 RepID=UPI0035E192A0
MAHGPHRRFAFAFISAVGALSTIIAGAAVSSAAAASPRAALVGDPASLVNPLLDTGDGGAGGSVNSFPGPDVPFGMVQFGPDTSPHRQDGGGYYYGDSQIQGFSLTHLDGPGCKAFGDVPILPTVGALPSRPGSATVPFSHSAESASAGYYEVQTGSPAVKTELTTSARSALGRFTFPATTQANLLLKLAGSQAGNSATDAQVIGDNEVQGTVSSGHFCGGPDTYTVNVDITFDHSFTAHGTWSGSTITPGSQQVRAKATKPAAVRDGSKGGASPAQPHPTYPGTAPTGRSLKSAVSGPDGVYLTFDTTQNQRVQAKVGISFVSTANAARNAHTTPGFGFDAMHAAAVADWNKELSRLQIGGGSTDRQQVFYTALYHSLLHPNIFSDANGQYMGFDNKVHTIQPGHVQMANYSGWDIYRSQAQLEALVDPQAASDSAQSMVNDAAQNNGMLPKWALANGESYVMNGDPADGILGGYYAFGARKFDTRSALSYALAEADKPSLIRPGLNYYTSLGYLPSDGTYGCCNFYGSASTTLEYAGADFELAHFASALGDRADADRLTRRSQNWQNLFNPATGLIQPKTASGTWAPVTPTTQSNYVEGNASQYRWEVGWNEAGLFNALGGNKAVNPTLDTFWTHLNDGPGSPYSFWDNQFEYAYPWNYDFTGQPYKTQALVHRIRTQLYLDSPQHSEGDNDDLGATASMGVLTMLGFFPEYTSTADVTLNSPEFPLEIIHLAGGRTLTFNAPHASASNIYIQSMQLNGKAYTKPWLPGSIFTTGATVAFTLGSTPNTSWGSRPQDAPPSYKQGELPALGYVSSQAEAIPTSSSTRAALGAREVTGTRQSVTWSATASSGVTVSPDHGTLSTAPGSDGTEPITLTAGPAEGRYQVTFHMKTAGGTKLPDVSMSLAVARRGELWPYETYEGIYPDGSTFRSGFNGGAFAYSQDALTAAGSPSGGTVTSHGITYTWPITAAGRPDHITMAGQTIPLDAPAGATTLGLLGAATNARATGAHGQLVIHYTDGSTSTATIGLADWTLGAGKYPPIPGDTEAITTPYRDTSSGGKDATAAHVYAITVPLDPGKQVASITLPSMTGGTGSLFALGYQS